MFDFFNNLFFSRQYIPHGHCYLWQPGLLWLHVLSDLLIALAYYSIPLLLVYFVRQRDDVPFRGVFILFILFILSCGTTHMMSIWTLWHPAYWLSGLIKSMTAIVSMYAAFELIPTLPQALALRSPAELEAANQALELEIANRQQTELALQRLNLELEQRVEQRTKEYKDSEQRFRSLFEAAPDFIYLLNLKGEIEQVNPAIVQQSGYTESELIDQELIHFLTPISQERSQRELSELLHQRQRETRNEVEFICRDTTILTMDCSYNIVGDTQDEDAYILVLQRDISDRKRTEIALQQTNQELLASNQELERFAYLASHDLREPLRMVTSFTRLLSQRYSGQLDPEADQIIGFAVDGATRMEELISDLLEYSRVGQQNQTLDSVDCSTILDRSLNNLQLLISETNTEIIRGPLPIILGETRQLIQLFQNLIDNAIVYRGEESPRVEIRAEVQQDQWLFSVKDNGIGIEPQHNERIFDIFQRLHTRQEYPGTGIGLAICHRIVERHGGEIWVESQLGQGATFYFTLPRTTDMVDC